ncbi:MAG TPA: hypothetical protein VHA78_03650 [Candidatus Peribacteraceae bacterium]|nr:hypothetical protein [Candidatus Peribacteraceae bacterium]
MHVTLSWDLIVVVFFAIVLAYSFIVGKNESVKIIIASYIAIVAVAAIGNLLDMGLGGSQSMMQMLGFSLDKNTLSTVKLILFVAVIIFLAIRGGFEMEYAKDIDGVWEIVLTAGFGIATAGLLLTALLTYIGAEPLLDPNLGSAPLLQPLLEESQLVGYMVQYQAVWFALPAVLLLIVGFVNGEK